MSASESNHPYGEKNPGNREEDANALRGEMDSTEEVYPSKDVKGMEELSSDNTSDPYDFDRYHPQREIDRQDQIRAERVARRRIPANALQKYMGKLVPYGGLLATGLNLASSSIGAGIIAMPSAFNSSGLVMALIYMVIIAFLTIYSYYLLGIAAEKTGLRNYEQMVRALIGPGADYFLAFCMWVFSFGAEVSYVMYLKDVLTRFAEDAHGTPDFLLTIWGQRVLTIVVWAACMLPLCLPKEINTLRYFSLIAIVLIIYFVICMVVHSATHGLQENPRPKIVMFQTGNTAIGGLSTFVFAFMNQLNAMECAGELYKPTPKRLMLGATIAVVIVFSLYLFAGLFGYLDFGPLVTGSALQLYNPVKEPMMGVGYAGILLKLCVGFGLHMIPVRDAVYHCVGADVHTLAWWKNTLTCAFMALLALIAGLFIPNINVVFGLVGGFSGGFIGFIYPALMVMYCGNWTFTSVGWFHYFSTYFLMLVGVIGVVWGTASAVYSQI